MPITIYVPRVMGGTIVYTLPGPGTPIPTVVVMAQFRGGESSALFRSGEATTVFRDGESSAAFRNGETDATFRSGLTTEESR